MFFSHELKIKHGQRKSHSNAPSVAESAAQSVFYGHLKILIIT